MPEAQLRLFPEPRPLLERFGADFFRAAPARPGVYLMTGERDRVLYIGKARNLRQRLSSYKYPRSSRKLMRLACRVRSITWELCDDNVKDQRAVARVLARLRGSGRAISAIASPLVKA